MKKILSLLLILTMLTVAMVSCKKDEPTQDPTPPAQDTRYTVTAEEWTSTCALTNFTLDYVTVQNGTRGGETFTSTTTVQVKSTADISYNLYVSSPETPDSEPGTDESYCVLEDGVMYYLQMKGTEVERVSAREDEEMPTLADSMDFEDVTFADLTYNEANKSYVWTYSESEDGVSVSMTYSFFFENGALVKVGAQMSAEADGYSQNYTVDVTVSNIGTTTVTAPAFNKPQQ